MKARAYGTGRQRGFTLVEIAIVLVIIGLLLGGILKGQEMITQARIKNVINDFNGITAAVNSYRDRYRMLPGDDNGAEARWGLATGSNGNGNGVIAGKYNDTAGAESQLFWLHLRQAGFVAGAGREQPRNSTSGIIGVETGDGNGGTALASGTVPGFTSLIVCSTSIPDKVAGAVDTQMDDGQPQLGQMRAFTGTANADVPATTTTNTSYGEAGTTYNLCQPL
jgi:prepilin-type N-terminal cleavage/methylation domain-containing protein